MSERLEHINKFTAYQIRNLLDLQAMQYREHLLKTGKYSDPSCLNHYEYSIHAQCGEDGIIEEIFRRIGATNRYFVEFGVGNGLQNNTVSLLLKNWVGVWMEAEQGNAEIIRSKFSAMLTRHRLTFLQTFVTAESIESLFAEQGVPNEFDLLSIDIDGNDYWVWNAITKYQPRVIICEYNGRYGPHLQWVMQYDPTHAWNGSCYYGASLKSLELLGKSKGYMLVGCNLAGVNAFFIREDLVGELFVGPFTSEHLFEPQRTFLVREPIQANDFGPFVTD